jgi:hypothetical protein
LPRLGHDDSSQAAKLITFADAKLRFAAQRSTHISAPRPVRLPKRSWRLPRFAGSVIPENLPIHPDIARRAARYQLDRTAQSSAVSAGDQGQKSYTGRLVGALGDNA